MIKTTTTILTMTILIAGIIAPALNNAPVFAATNIVSNGSFETISVSCSNYTTLQNGDPGITGWTIGDSSVDLICGYWPAQDGTNSLDMSGLNPGDDSPYDGAPSSAGSVSQDLTTISGATYDVAFWLSGNTDGGSDATKHLTVTAPGYSAPFTHLTTGKGTDWEEKTFSFTAAGASSTLKFTSDEARPFGAALDNVSAVLSACPTGYDLVDDDCISSNQDPVCTATVSPATLWSPNHKMVLIAITGVTDPDGDPVVITVDGVTQDEPTNGIGDGDKSPDAILDPLQVRSERSGLGDGRVYEIAFTADDDNGGSCDGTVLVGVPHSVKSTVIDSVVRYDSTS